MKERIPLVCHLEDKLYDMYLPLKFHIKKRLEVADKLESGFYVIDGLWNGEFPFLTTLFNEPITTNFTVYTVDYGYGAIISSKSKESCFTSVSQTQYPRKPSAIRTQSTEGKLSFSSENALERKGSISDVVVDRFLPLFIFGAFKTMYLIHLTSEANPLVRTIFLVILRPIPVLVL